MSYSIQLNQLEIDLENYRLLRDGQPIRLTRTEWALLGELVKHKNQVLSHRILLQRVWGQEYHDELDYVHTYISRLRRKIEIDAKEPQYILTESGLGYTFHAIESNGHITQATTHTPAPQNQSIIQTINPLPQTTERYVGRHTERAEIIRLFDEGARLISIYGRGGVGKTALACRAIHELLDSDGWQGMVFLSANRTGINLARIFSDFKKLLGNAWELPEVPTTDRSYNTQRITSLLDQLQDGRYLLLLDNLETLQKQATGELIDNEMTLFFQQVLEQASGLRLLITSREPLILPRTAKTRERMISLEQGLSEGDAITLLRQCDPDNITGLRNATDEKLKIIVERTQGFPRALEAVAGLLLEDQLLTLDDLVADTRSISGEVNEVLVQNALERLTPEAMRVMEVAAAFKRPVSQQALVTILAKFNFDHGLRPILNRLVRAFFLEYNREVGVFSMHPIDQAYCYQNIPQIDETYHLKALHRQIAEYFKTQIVEFVETIDDLEANIQIFEHLIQAEAYQEAAEHLIQLDTSHLSRWGHYTELKEMYSKLVNHLADSSVARQVWLRAGEAHRGAGYIQEAIDFYQQALESAKVQNLLLEMAQANSSIGWANYDQGHFTEAMDYWQEAITLFGTISDKRGVANVRGGMGWVSYLQGQYALAEENFQQATVIFTQLNDQLGIAVNLGDEGIVQMAQGDYEAAIAKLERSFAIADEANSLREISYKGSYLAIAYLLSDNPEAAHSIIKLIVQYEEVPVNRPMVEALHGVILTCIGKSHDAIVAFQNALRYADQVLKTTTGLYHVRYAHSLANAGLTALQNKDLEATLLDYGKAKAICAEPGVTRLQLNLLNALTACLDEKILIQVKELLQDDLDH